MGSDPVKIETLEADSGEKVFGFIDVKDHFGAISQLPVGIINGTKEGPRLLMTAGVHACEYAGIEGVTRMYKQTEPKGLKGVLTVIPCMNLPAFRMRKPFLVPFDGKNLGRVFPGRTDGSPAEVIAYVVMKKILPKADFVVDCHGADIGEKVFPLAICQVTEDEKLSQKSMALANATGLDYAILADIRPGAEEIGVAGLSFRGMWLTEANQAGVPAIVCEAGLDGQYDEGHIAIHVRCLANIMKFLDMIPGEIERESDRPSTTYLAPFIMPIRTASTGVFNPLVGPRDQISEGQIVAEIKDLKGDVVETVKSGGQGLLVMTNTKRVVNTGDELFWLIRPEA